MDNLATLVRLYPLAVGGPPLTSHTTRKDGTVASVTYTFNGWLGQHTCAWCNERPVWCYCSSRRK